MQQFFNNRYVQLAGLTIGLSILIFLILWVVTTTIGLNDFPAGLQAVLAILGAGMIVYKFLAQRIA